MPEYQRIHSELRRDASRNAAEAVAGLLQARRKTILIAGVDFSGCGPWLGRLRSQPSSSIRHVPSTDWTIPSD